MFGWLSSSGYEPSERGSPLTENKTSTTVEGRRSAAASCRRREKNGEVISPESKRDHRSVTTLDRVGCIVLDLRSVKNGTSFEMMRKASARSGSLGGNFVRGDVAK